MADRPKLEIVRAKDGADEIFVNGKFLADSTDSAVVAAQRVARALGADIDEVDDPTPQPYTYFVAYDWVSSTQNGRGQCWANVPKAIEGNDDLQAVVRDIRANSPHMTSVIVTNFICTDGPS
jgi:hypothetical protein